MELTIRERQRLAEIERQLSTDEPCLNLALSQLSLRPLRTRWIPPIVSRVRRAVPQPLVLAITILGTGLAMLVTGAARGLVPVMFAGAAMSQFGPVLAYWLLVGRRPGRTGSRPRPSALATSRR